MGAFNKILKTFTSLFKGDSSKTPRDESPSTGRDMYEPKDVEVLMASIVHEIKNPLAVLQVEIEKMRRSFQNDAQIMKFADRLEEQRRRINAATSTISVFRYGRDRTIREDPEAEPINLEELINDSVKGVKREIRGDEIYFRIEVRAREVLVMGNF